MSVRTAGVRAPRTVDFVSRADDNPVVRAVFRLPRSAYLPVLFLGLGVTVLVSSPAWTAVYLVPLLAALFVARRATVVDARQITVRAVFGRERIAWSRVRGLLISERGHVSVALDDQSAVLLPYVRVRHLPVLSQVSGNLVPAIPKRSQPAAEPVTEAATEPAVAPVVEADATTVTEPSDS
jgi:Bacterial PH domain